MKKETYKDKAIQHLFNSQDIFFPGNLNERIMQKVYKAQKRKGIRNLFIAGATSLILLTGVILMLKYYLKFNFSTLLPNFIVNQENISFPSFIPIFFICIIVCSLLWLDYRLRKRWNKS